LDKKDIRTMSTAYAFCEPLAAKNTTSTASRSLTWRTTIAVYHSRKHSASIDRYIARAESRKIEVEG
jgi:hypothetical protein